MGEDGRGAVGPGAATAGWDHPRKAGQGLPMLSPRGSKGPGGRAGRAEASGVTGSLLSAPSLPLCLSGENKIFLLQGPCVSQRHLQLQDMHVHPPRGSVFLEDWGKLSSQDKPERPQRAGSTQSTRHPCQVRAASRSPGSLSTTFLGPSPALSPRLPAMIRGCGPRGGLTPGPGPPRHCCSRADLLSQSQLRTAPVKCQDSRGWRTELAACGACDQARLSPAEATAVFWGQRAEDNIHPPTPPTATPFLGLQPLATSSETLRSLRSEGTRFAWGRDRGSLRPSVCAPPGLEASAA